MQEDQRFVDIKFVSGRYSICKSTIYNWVGNNSFPKPKKFGCMTRWAFDELKKWEAEREVFGQQSLK
jgi:predicted DNA-binding transcriptional regulator AlpA